jgi:hypothetical protein
LVIDNFRVGKCYPYLIEPRFYCFQLIQHISLISVGKSTVLNAILRSEK